MSKLLQLVILIGLLSGCASTRVSLFTNPPGAKVYAKPLGSGRLQMMGETPVTVTGEQIEKEYGGSGPVLLEFRKEGFQTTTALVTELSSQDLNINMEMVPQGGLDDLQRLNGLIETLFECQRLVQVKRYDEALSRLKEVEKQAPQISTIYELQGGIYYLQRKFPDALDAYRLAVRYNPRNAEALRMRDMLEKTFGIKRSAVADDSAEAQPKPENEEPKR